jgi:hypothetical protein
MSRVSYEAQMAGRSVDVPCDPVGYECPIAAVHGEAACFADLHHLLSPRAAYRTKVEKRARNAAEMKITICRFLHEMINATEEHPPKPGREELVEIGEQAG